MEEKVIVLHIPALEGATDAIVRLVLPAHVLAPSHASVELRDSDGHIQRGCVSVESEAA